MGTLKQAVDRVAAAKTAIGAAITAKGGTVAAGDGLEEFAADIATIPSGVHLYQFASDDVNVWASKLYCYYVQGEGLYIFGWINSDNGDKIFYLPDMTFSDIGIESTTNIRIQAGSDNTFYYYDNTLSPNDNTIRVKKTAGRSYVIGVAF